MPGDRDAPRQLADLDRLDHLEGGYVNHGYVVRYAVGGQKILFVRRESQVPDPLADQKVFLDRMRGAVDHCNAVGRTERDEAGLTVGGDADAHRLDRLLAQAGDVKADLFRDLALHGVDDAHGAADLGRYPQLRAVALELRETRARIHQHVRHDLTGRRVDEMRHVGRFGRVDQDLPVRAQPHALGLDADLHLADRYAACDVDDRDGVVVLVGDVEQASGGILGKQLGVGTGRQVGDHLVGAGVDHLDGVVVADRHQDELPVLGELDAARPLADLDGLHHLERVGVDHADGVALLVRHIGGEGPGRQAADRQQAVCDKCRENHSVAPHRRHGWPTEGCISSRADRCRGYRARRTGAKILPAATPRRSFYRPPGEWADAAAGSSRAGSGAVP